MRLVTAIAILLSMLAGAAQAEEPRKPELQSEKPASAAIEKNDLPDAAATAARQRALELRTAMNDEIATRLAAEKTTLATLTGELERAARGDDQLAVQRRIQAAKQTAWRDILAIQLKFANLGGHAEQAADLEERIARLDEGLSQPQAPQRSQRSTQTGTSKGGE